MPTKISTCCDAAPVSDESDLCGDCKEHTTFYYPDEYYWATGYGSCDHCGITGPMHQENQASYNDQGEIEYIEIISSLCDKCANS